MIRSAVYVFFDTRVLVVPARSQQGASYALASSMPQAKSQR
jgi:hypothetical protein